MANKWFISDTHFWHRATCTKFKKPDGVTPLRPFADEIEMNEIMIARWNERVMPGDKVYHLGDVMMGFKKDAPQRMPLLSRLNGRKRLIMGNHDMMGLAEYSKYFEEIYGVRVLDDLVLSHVPLRPENITERWNCNVHGHLHAWDISSGLYLNVSVEHTDFAPISLDEVRCRIAEKRQRYPVTRAKFDRGTGGPG